jgi:hypothetical protein
MRLGVFAITAAVAAGLSGPATAQEGSSQPVAQPATQAVAPANPVAHTTYDTGNHWIASAFVGTNFGSGRNSDLDLTDTTNQTSSINFGGQAAYLWGGYFGAEALVDFAPSFELNNVQFENNPTVNSYMANAIAAAPFGSNHQYIPYFSGGVGAVQLRSTIFVLDPTNAPDINTIGTISADGTRFGGDVGGGIMGFSGKWGFRGDLRYYKTSVDNNVDLTDLGNGNLFTQSVLSGLAFWKANVGVAFRW